MPLFNQDKQNYDLPTDALIVEELDLGSKGYPNRALILWTLKPEKHSLGNDPEYPYTCPDKTRGSHYSGLTRVSLLNTKTLTVINTVEIKSEYLDGEDSFDIPYAIREGYYYKVPGNPKKGEERKPQIIWLKDYNGDGMALEFALFDAFGCMGLQTALIGYSPSQDRVIQYQIRLEVEEGGNRSTDVFNWMDYLFSKEPLRPGYWKYEIDYRGRDGPLCKYEITYNVKTEEFEGRLIVQH